LDNINFFRKYPKRQIRAGTVPTQLHFLVIFFEIKLYAFNGMDVLISLDDIPENQKEKQFSL